MKKRREITKVFVSILIIQEWYRAFLYMPIDTLPINTNPFQINSNKLQIKTTL